jgi:dTMP kinase
MFITFEGCEGCGKSTQAKLLHKGLLKLGIDTLFTMEPGGTPLGSSIRKLLKVRQNLAINPEAELLLFAACRAQLVRDIIRPALNTNRVVICDRFADSTVVYQGYGRGLDLNMIYFINDIATDRLKPDITFLLDVEPDIGLERKRNIHLDRFDAEDINFHSRIRNGYLSEAKKDPSRWRIINALQPIPRIKKIILEIVLKMVDK